MSGGDGQVNVDPNQLWGHGLRSQNRSTDYYVIDSGSGDDGWPSQRAYADAHSSMGGAGKAFGDRQQVRGQAVSAAADGFTSQDFDAAKLLQAVGGFVGPAFQALAALGQGFFQGFAQGLSAGAQALSGLFTSGSTLASQGLPKGPQLGTGASPGVSPSPGAPTPPPAGSQVPPADVARHNTAPDDKHDPERSVTWS